MPDSDILDEEEVCDACLLLLSDAPVIVTIHYSGDVPLHFHPHCYETISAFLPPPEALSSNLEEKVRHGNYTNAPGRQSWPGSAPNLVYKAMRPLMTITR